MSIIYRFPCFNFTLIQFKILSAFSHDSNDQVEFKILFSRISYGVICAPVKSLDLGNFNVKNSEENLPDRLQILYIKSQQSRATYWIHVQFIPTHDSCIRSMQRAPIQNPHTESPYRNPTQNLQGQKNICMLLPKFCNSV